MSDENSATTDWHHKPLAHSKRRADPPPIFLEYSFRPFFMLAGLWAAMAAPLWLATFVSIQIIPYGVDPLIWHQHEMLFAFAGAAIAGFILTAIPNWTGRLPVSGWRLGVLVGCWLLGRVGTLSAELIGAIPAALLDLAFLTLLAVTIARELIRGKNWRNLPMLALISLFGLGNWLVHFEHIGLADTADFGIRLAIFVLAVLVTVIGGRIIPSFTRNWLKHKGALTLPAPAGTLDAIALGAMVLVLVTQLLWGHAQLTAFITLSAALLHGVRLARWKFWAVLSEPLLWVLHLGYGWFVFGLLLVGLAGLNIGLPKTAALHALTMGGFSTMILAVMTRASLGHTGRALTADVGTTIVYVLVSIAAVARLVAVFLVDGYLIALWISAGSWTAAFSLFTILYWPVLTKPKIQTP